MLTIANDGKAFERAVQDTLSVLGYSVEAEQLLGSQRVDCLARTGRWGKDWVIAVECKDWARPVSKQDVTAVWTNYQPLYTSGLVNEVLIVARSGFAPAARAFISSQPGLEGQEYRQLAASGMDLRSYVAGLIDVFEATSDGLPHYYIEPRTADGRDLTREVIDWINASNTTAWSLDPLRPMAILGAYGAGKSSFAAALCALLAKKALADPLARVPILIRLAELAGEQSLEGLLGKHFSATHNVPGYSFAAFAHLNRLGRFVIVLDGFDEMKQMLSWREFRYNLSQLNRLHSEQSRLIILGRPTAFENDFEHNFALHGLREDRGAQLREAGWPDYQELELAPLTPEEMQQFLSRYLDYRQSPIATDPAAMAKLWTTIASKHLRDIARRPVQLRMLAEILPSYNGQTEDLDVATVYDYFIDHILDQVIEREEQKLSRLAFSREQRRHFLTQFALWLWQQPGDTVSADEVPDVMVQPFAGGEDLATARRDLIMSLPLDRRAGERIRFPHRSFQEFLVAEQCWELLCRRELTPAQLDRLLNGEIVDFIRAMAGRVQHAMARSLLRELNGAYSQRLVRALFLYEETASDLLSSIDTHRSRSVRALAPWEILVLSMWADSSPRSAVVPTPAHFAKAATLGNEGSAIVSLFALLRMPVRTAGHAEAIMRALEILLLRSGDTERYRASQVRAGAIRPIEMDLVTSGRGVHARIGRLLGGASLRQDVDENWAPTRGNQVEVRWIPHDVIRLMCSIQWSGKRLNLRGLRTALASVMPKQAFLTEWHDPAIWARLSLAGDVSLGASAEIGQHLQALQRAASAVLPPEVSPSPAKY